MVYHMKEARKHIGFSQEKMVEELLKQCGREISQSQYSKCERGTQRVSVKLVEDISKITGLNMNWFFRD